MSNFSGYKTTAFNETQKFFVLDPATGSPSFVQGSDLVSYITPMLDSVLAASTRLAAENADYEVGTLVQTSGATSPGDGLASAYLVVAGGTGDFPMLNGNDLLVVTGDDALRAQLISNAVGLGSDLVAHTGTADTVTEALDKRTIFVGSVAELEALSGSTGDVINLSLPMRGGDFVWRSGDQSTKVTSDPFQGIWIAGAGDATGASGAWMRRYFGPINVLWFGVVGDAVTDDGPAIQAANDYVEKTLRYGGVLFFPKPTGGYKSFQKLRVGGWVTWRGEGAFSTTIFWDSSVLDDLIQLGPDETGGFSYSGSYAFGSRIEDMDLNSGDIYRGLDNAVVVTNGSHQNSGLLRCQIRGFTSIGVNYNDGLGAPASFHIEDVNFQASTVAPTTGDKIGIRSNAGGMILNLKRVQLETDNTSPFDQAVSMIKDHLVADDVHIEGATNGIVLSQNEATIRTASLTGVTGKSDVINLVLVSATNNVEYQLNGVNNTTISATNINALVDNDKGVTIGGVGGASICSFTNVNRKGGNNIAHASLNYSQTTTSIAGGFGVASVVRNSAGNFDITYSEPVKNQNVVAPCSVRFSAGASGTIIPTPLSVNAINVKTYNSAGALADPDRFHVAVFDGS